jgi:regulator of protease activity HflC (stomatin/prohibitin superfamily)
MLTLLPLKKFLVRQHECGLLFKRGDFVRFVNPGTFILPNFLGGYSLETFDLAVPEFSHKLAEFLRKHCPEEVTRRLHSVDLGAQQVGILYKQGQLADILPPNSRLLYWRGIIDIRVEVYDLTTDYTVLPALAALLSKAKLENRYCRTPEVLLLGEVPEYHQGVLTVDGRQAAQLSAGSYAYWRFNRNLQTQLYDLRPQEIEITGQEVLSKDKVTLRFNLLAHYRLQDVQQVLRTVPKPSEFIYRALQLALRGVIGTRSLDNLLEDKTALDQELTLATQQLAQETGILFQHVAIKDVVLPGEMRTLLNKVVEAEKAAQANLIRRREETAATRSLLNTAKVMEDNPVALRLKELETLEKITEKVGTLSVYGGLEGLLSSLVRLKP